MNNQYPQQQNPEQFYSHQSTPISSDEMYANILQEERVKNIIAQVAPENHLLEIEMRIRGYKKDLYTGEWKKIDPNGPEVNGRLVERVTSYLSSILSQNTSLSNLTEQQINGIMRLVIRWVSDELDSHSEEYGLRSDYTERTRIGHIIFNSIFMVLSRALNGQEARRLWKSISLSEGTQFGQPKSSSKWKEALQFWK